MDPFEIAWPLVRRWLEAEPDRNAKEIFQRLQVDRPGVFPMVSYEHSSDEYGRGARQKPDDSSSSIPRSGLLATIFASATG